MQCVVLDDFLADGLESSQSHVESDLGGLDSAGVQRAENFRSEVQAGGGSGDRSELAGVDSLVAVAVGGRVRAGDVRGERDMSDALDGGEEILAGGEADAAFSEFAAGGDFGLQLVAIAEKKMLADSDFAAGANETFPFVGIFSQLFCEEDFDASLEKIAGSGIARTERLGFEAGATAVETGRNDARIVEDHQVIRAEKARKFAELAVFESAGGSVQMKKTRGGAVGQRVLSDQFLREFEIEIGDEHAG